MYIIYIYTYIYRYHVIRCMGQLHPITVYRTILWCALFWYWVSSCVPFTNSLIECSTTSIGDFMAILLYPSPQQSWKGGILVSPCLSVCCVQNGVHFVSSTILIKSIAYFHILSSNFRRCVACKVYFKIQKFEIFSEFVILSLSSFVMGSNMT